MQDRDQSSYGMINGMEDNNVLFVGGSSDFMASSHIRNGCLSVCIVHFHLIYHISHSVPSVPSSIFSLDLIVRVLNYGQYGQLNTCVSEELSKLMEIIYGIEEGKEERK